MRNQFLPLVRNELTKAMRRKLPYFGLLILGLVAFITYFAAGRMNNGSTVNGWGYLAFSMQLIFTDIGPIFVTVFAAMLLSEETGTGTIRSLLAAPIHRWELYLAKATVGLLYALALSFSALLGSWLLAKTHYHFGHIGDSFGTIYAQRQVLREFVIGYLLSWIPLAALVMYGLLIGTLVRSSGAAVATAIGCLILIDFTKHWLGIESYIFTTYITYPWVNLQQMAQGMDYAWLPDVWKMAGWSGAYLVATTATGLVVFTRSDLNH
ncbi:MAG TPA: ABC transporter permease [Verrucomicrobiae bacterium]